MTLQRWCVTALVAILVTGFAMPALAQEQTGNITGRAVDTSGGALPGVTVSITSSNLIGGARTAVTDEQGIYRFTLLPGGIYTVSFNLTGFTNLNIEGVKLSAGATMTINGKLDVASLQESITVTSQSPTIDLESSKVAVNWDQQKLDELPYARSLTGLVSLIPGLYATSLDVGGSSVRHRLRPGRAHVRPRRRRRGQLRRHDLGPDLRRLRHLRRSADHHRRQGRGRDESRRDDEPGREVRAATRSRASARRITSRAICRATTSRRSCCAKGYAPGVNKFTSLKDYYGEIGGPIIRDRLWFYASHRDASSGNFIPGFVSLADREQVEFYTKLQDPTAKITYQISKSNKFEAMGQVGRKWQPYRTASRFVPLESTQNQDSMSLIGPSFKYLSILSTRATFDASVQRGGYWWPDIPWTTDVRKTDLRRTQHTARRAARSSRPIASRAAGSTAARSRISRRRSAAITS